MKRQLRELAELRKQAGTIGRGNPVRRVAEELRALQVQAVEHRGPEPMLALAKFERPFGLGLATIDAKQSDEVVVVTERPDDPPELIAARDAKLEDLRTRGFGDVLVVIVKTAADRLSVERGTVALPPRNSPRLSPPGASSANPQSADHCLFEENQ